MVLVCDMCFCIVILFKSLCIYCPCRPSYYSNYTLANFQKAFQSCAEPGLAVAQNVCPVSVKPDSFNIRIELPDPVWSYGLGNSSLCFTLITHMSITNVLFDACYLDTFVQRWSKCTRRGRLRINPRRCSMLSQPYRVVSHRKRSGPRSFRC